MNTFRTELVNLLNEKLGDGYIVRPVDVTKNNGVMYSGITICENGCNIAPTIYINEWFDKFEKGDVDYEVVVNKIIDIYNANKTNSNFEVQKILDFDKVRDHILLNVVNKERNYESFYMNDICYCNVPCVKDLAIVFYIELSFGGCNASVTIKSDFLNKWGIDISELLRIAFDNLEKQEYFIENIIDFLPIHDDIPDVGMFVCSNKKKYFGASAIMRKDVLKRAAGVLGGDFYIIPSSVHELLFIKMDDSVLDDVSAHILEIIANVNENEVDEDEILSDNLYIYRHKNESIEVKFADF